MEIAELSVWNIRVPYSPSELVYIYYMVLLSMQIHVYTGKSLSYTPTNPAKKEKRPFPV